jgi:hypothetical protein
LLDFDHEGGSESLEVKLFKEKDIPWDRIAFVPIYETLKLFFEDRRNGTYPLRLGAIASDAPKGGEHRREVSYFLLSLYYCNFILPYLSDYDKVRFKLTAYNRRDCHGNISLFLSEQRMRRLCKEGTKQHSLL